MAPNKLQRTKKENLNNPQNRSIVREKALRGHWQDYQDCAEKNPHIISPTFNELKTLIIFLLFNLSTLLLIDLYPAPSETISAALGMAPPLLWINVTCAVYFFTEFVLALCRNSKTNTDRFALKQLIFLSAFYVFYWYAGALQQHFTILLIGGALLQLLEAFARKNPLRSAAEDH